MEDIDTGLLDPVLKCIQGNYTDRFIYVGSCATGQVESTGIIVGGGLETYDYNLNQYDLDLYLADEPKMDNQNFKVF